MRASDPNVKWPAAIVLVFLVSRAIAMAAGLRFDTTPLTTHWQFLDPVILEQHYLRALTNLHSQPPLFNAVVGAVLQLPSALQHPAFHALSGALGLALALSIYGVLRELSVSPVGAALVAIGYTLSSEALLYENYLFYPYPVAAALTAAFYFALRGARTGSRRNSIAAAALLTCVALTYALFHLVWLAPVMFLIRPSSPQVGRVPAGLAYCVLFCCAAVPYLSNSIRFGTPAASTWMGQNLASAYVYNNTERIDELVEDGTVDELLGIGPFRPLSVYTDRGILILPPEETSAPAELLSPRKSDGQSNYNHVAYVELGRRFRHATLAAIRTAPKPYVLNVLRSLCMTLFAPSTDYFFVRTNRAAIHTYADTWDLLMLRVGPKVPVDDYSGVRLMFVRVLSGALLLPVLVLGGIACGVRGVMVTHRSAAPVRRVVLAMTFTCLCVMAIMTLANAVETNRIRVTITPLLLILIVAEVDQWRKRRSARASTRPEPAASS